eukprot:TRINITY_DN1319_c1_g1_i1.p1 TRINITY_DN1319_c1_g1~~TRINITY_DN1319_c1_g1_i1.p1  ORF type:complete len:168 (-),score=37.56 TRINITY_DN1319_c1_g1_i1:187-690(-)
MATVLPISTPHPLFSTRSISHHHQNLIKPSPKPIFCSSSSSLQTPQSTVIEESPPPSDDVIVDSAIENAEKVQIRGCKACGREEIEKGCNGEGRIQGGIGTVPGFGWWPIKAFRPCPGFVASGGRYRRRGQSMDEVAFGRGDKETSMEIAGEAQSSKRRQSPKKFRR